jgi:hypothetical protein
MRENIEVETASVTTDNKTTHSAAIVDRKANRAWAGTGDSAGKAMTEATRKFLGDRRAREYVGEP